MTFELEGRPHWEGLPEPRRSQKLAAEEPVLDWLELEIWEAFMTLHAARPSGMGPSAIPYPWIPTYCDEQGITGHDDRETYQILIQALDAAWLEHAQKKIERERKTKSSGVTR